MVPEDVTGILRPYLPTEAAIFLFMNAGDQAPLILPKMQESKSLTLH
jgi:hypothetical protein